MQKSLKKNEYMIIFNHVPKAGGTSLIHFFTEVFGKDRVFRHKARDSRTDTYSPGIEDLTREDRQKYWFIAGHFGYGNHKLFNRPVKYIGVIREPLERAFSHYHFLRKSGRRDLKEQALSMTFEEYLQYRLGLKSNNIVESSQISMLTGRNDFSAAKEIIQRDYLYCCATPQLNEMQKRLARHYQRPDLLPVTVNKTRKEFSEMNAISRETADILDSRYDLDRRLLEWVEQEFQKV